MIKPLGYCVLVRPDPLKETLKSGVIEIPQEVEAKQRIEVTTGTLVAIGNLAWKGMQGSDDTPWASVGAHVIYAKYGGKVITDPETGEKLILLQDKDVIGEI
mgnify:CR=1 FL=1